MVVEHSQRFAAFVAERHTALLKFAMVLTGDANMAEDIVSDVLDRAFEQWDRIGAMPAPLAYVRKMIVNEHLSWRRRWLRAVPSGIRPAAPPTGGVSGDPVVDRQDMIARLASLPARQRTVIVMRYYLDLPDAEIADVLGCRAATVRSHAARALATLRIDLTAEPNFRDPGVTGTREATADGDLG